MKFKKLVAVLCAAALLIFSGGGLSPGFGKLLDTAVKASAESNCLTFTAEENGSSVKLKLYQGSLQVYKGGEWEDYTSGSVISLNKGESVKFRGRDNSNKLLFGLSNHVEITGKVACSGNIMTLLDYENPDTAQMGNYCFNNMFRGCAGLTKAPALPATDLAINCYNAMFRDCTGLTEAPALPATALAINCYNSMFRGCTGLTEAPALPAIDLADSCYSNMFYGCIGLTEAPALPATDLADSCYSNMFYDCTGLTEAPALPATALAYSCYFAMFYGCIGLTEAPALPATALAYYCYSAMFQGCTNIKLYYDSTPDHSDVYQIPSGGKEITSVPNGALEDMFKNTGGDNIGNPDVNTKYYMHKEAAPDPAYTVNIPAKVTLGNTAAVSVTDVANIPSGKNLVVTISGSGTNGAFEVENSGDTLNYTVTKDSTNIAAGGTIISTATAVNATLTFNAPTAEPQYAGEYKGTVTFNVSIS